MSRKPTIKELTNTRLASGYGGWIYCDSCGKNIGYLCYVTYDSFLFKYQCKCGNHGSMYITFRDVSSAHIGDNKPVTIKNRLCCQADQSPLFTVLEKALDSYEYEVVCSKCDTKYREVKIL